MPLEDKKKADPKKKPGAAEKAPKQVQVNPDLTPLLPGQQQSNEAVDAISVRKHGNNAKNTKSTPKKEHKPVGPTLRKVVRWYKSVADRFRASGLRKHEDDARARHDELKTFLSHGLPEDK